MIPAIQALLVQLQTDAELHEQVGPKLTELEITELERQQGLRFPVSYKTFLKDFGDGAYLLYGCQAIDSAMRPSWLRAFRPSAPENVPVDGRNPISRDALRCLMSEDSNGGSWCWLTSEQSPDGEWPLAYYEQFEAKLFYQLDSFADWLRILVTNRSEVIFTLDQDNKLGLG